MGGQWGGGEKEGRLGAREGVKVGEGHREGRTEAGRDAEMGQGGEELRGAENKYLSR